MWTDAGVKSEIGVCELISTLKKKKKMQAPNEWSNILPSHHHTVNSKHYHVKYAIRSLGISIYFWPIYN